MQRFSRQLAAHGMQKNIGRLASVPTDDLYVKTPAPFCGKYLWKKYFMDLFTSNMISHPTHADIEHAAAPAVDAVINKKKDRNISCKYKAADAVLSSIGYLQRFKDK